MPICYVLITAAQKERGSRGIGKGEVGECQSGLVKRSGRSMRPMLWRRCESCFTSGRGCSTSMGIRWGCCPAPPRRPCARCWTFGGPNAWLGMMAKVSAQIAPLIGAEPREVTVANSTTINLHQLLSTLFRPTETRRKILVDETVFCSDLYAIRSHLALRGLDPVGDLVMVPTVDGVLLSEEMLIDRMEDDVACVVLPSV